MKRVFLMVVVAVLLAASCGRGQNSDKKNAGRETDESALAKTEEVISKETGDSTQYIFRKTHWGMTQKEIIASEGICPRLIDENMMIYATTYQNFQTEITYYFDKGSLGMAEYSISDPGMRIQNYLDLYNSLRQKLIDKYGKPTVDDYGKRGFDRVIAGNSFVFKKSPTLWNRVANWDVHDRGTEILLYLGYSTAKDDSTKSCDIQFKSNNFNIENLTGESR
jgi:hypothetical protein